jgi:hypothetical protein
MKKRIIVSVIFGSLTISMLVLGILAYNIAMQGNNTPIMLWVIESSIISFAGIDLTIKKRSTSG